MFLHIIHLSQGSLGGAGGKGQMGSTGMGSHPKSPPPCEELDKEVHIRRSCKLLKNIFYEPFEVFW